MGSSRLPNKMSLDLVGYPIIDWVLTRSMQCKLIDKIVLATSKSEENNYLIEFANKHMIQSFRGSENNVLSRYLEIASNEKADIIVRICADNPLVDWVEVDKVIDYFLKSDLDYVFNHIPALDNNYIDGIGAEVISVQALNKIGNMSSSSDHLEHVTKFIWDNKDIFKIGTLKAPAELSFPKIRLDIDTKEDLLFLRKSLNNFDEIKSPIDFNVNNFVKSLNKI